MLGLPLAGCQKDRCEQLCTRLAQQLGACMAEWPADWEDLDATSQANFRTQCENRWASTRADLEPRELDDALDQCEEAVADLVALRREGENCEHLRALYLD